jgi:hypothetical protein
MTDNWKDWWRRRGDDRLSLLLWAVWNPIGPVPLDEYESYTAQVVRVLKEARQADLELLPIGREPDDSAQRRRNKLYAASVAELATLLGVLRQEQMGMPPNADADRRTAETLLAWYGWEMDDLVG